MMSSETSTSSKRKQAAKAGRPDAGAKGNRTGAPAAVRGAGRGSAGPDLQVESAPNGSFQPVHLLILATVTAATAATLMAHGTRPANIVFIVLAVVATGIVAGAAYRALWPLATDVGTLEPEMVGGRTRAALEREKTIVLRAIKELEFDRAMGKVSEADCTEMIGRLRGRAVRLIRQLDAGSAGYRELIDREVKARLEARGRSVPSDVARPIRQAEALAAEPMRTSGETLGAGREAPPAPVLADAAVACAICGVINEPDARFCNQCGTKLAVRNLRAPASGGGDPVSY